MKLSKHRNKFSSLNLKHLPVSVIFGKTFQVVRLKFVMSEERSSEVEDNVVPVPQVITDEVFKEVQLKAQQVVNEFREREQYEVADELVKLLTVAETLHSNLKEERETVQQLTDQHVDATGRIEEALKISQRDRDTISKLREEIVEAWKLTDVSASREAEINEKLAEARTELAGAQKELKNLSYKIEDPAGSPLGPHKVTVLAECERLSAKVNDLNKRLLVQLAFNDEIQNKLDESLEKNREIFKEWDEATNESLSNRKLLDSLKSRLSAMDDKLLTTTDSMLHYQEQSEKRQVRLKERDRQLLAMTEDLEKSRNDNVNLKVAKAKLDANLTLCTFQMTDMKHELDQTLNFMRLKEDENRKLIIDNERNLKRIDGYIRKISAIETVVSKNEQEIINQRNEIVTAEKERDSIRRTNDAMRRENHNLSKKIDNLMREIEKRDGETLQCRLCKHFRSNSFYFQKRLSLLKQTKRCSKRTKF